MNYKRLMAIVFIAAMLGMILPVLPSGAHLPCDAAFLVKVNGLTNWIEFTEDGFDEEAIIFPELTYGLGSEFAVEVWILDVDDMFGYEFDLTWTGDDYIELVGYVVEEVWPEQIVIKPDVAYELAFVANGYYSMPYKQVVCAHAPSTGVSGDILLANLTFSIYNDVCYCEGYAIFEFNVENYLVTDSCSQEIDACDVWYASVIFLAAAPDIMMIPNNETNSAIWPYDGKFTKEIWVSDVVKMKSLHFDLRWNKWEGADMVELEYVEYDQVNLAHMDPALSTAVKDIVMEDVPDDNTTRRIVVDIFIKCKKTPLRGTFRVMTLTFKKTDPWDCGQPEYTYRQPHTWTPENATCKFYFYKGYFDVYCPDLNYIYFGSAMNPACGELVTDVNISGLPVTYGEAEWIDAYSGGCSVNLTTHITDDFAGVKISEAKINAKAAGPALYPANISQMTFAYKHPATPCMTTSHTDWLCPQHTVSVDYSAALSHPLTVAEATNIAGFGGAAYTSQGWFDLAGDRIEFVFSDLHSAAHTVDPTTTITSVWLRFRWDSPAGFTSASLWEPSLGYFHSLTVGAGWNQENINLYALGINSVAKLNALVIRLYGTSNCVCQVDWVQVDIGYTVAETQECGPRLAIGLNRTGWSSPRILISKAPMYANTSWTEVKFDGTSAFDLYDWDGENWTSIGTYHGWHTWSVIKTNPSWPAAGWNLPTANVTMFMVYMGQVGKTHGLTSGSGASSIPAGNAQVDLLKVLHEHPVPAQWFNMTFDFEPPCQTTKWYDKALYALTQDKIVNLYTFVPIPGDLNRDGIVDITDVLIIAQAYGNAESDPLDLNNKDGVDIFDIVIVCKQYGRTSP